MKKNKPTFIHFLYSILRMTWEEYEEQNELQKKAVEIDYIIRYGKPIKWF